MRPGSRQLVDLAVDAVALGVELGAAAPRLPGVPAGPDPARDHRWSPAVGGRGQRLLTVGAMIGLAWSTYPSGAQAAVSLGGLLAPPIIGAVVLWLSRTPWRAKIVLTALALVLAASLLMWVRSLAGLIAVPLLALLIGVVAQLGDRIALFAAHLVGVLLALNTVTGIDYLFVGSAEVAGRQYNSDIANVAEQLGGHYLIWGFLVAGLSLLICVAGLWLAWRRADRTAGPRAGHGVTWRPSVMEPPAA